MLAIAVSCVLLRLPQLLSSKLLLDGDECVVAIMAKHIMQGRGLPLYFYGQQYGFSFLECLFIIPFYELLGVCALAMKIGMLLLWTTGVLLLYRAFVLLNKGNKWLPLLLLIVFICSPAWAVWSMKARGGYLTSFTLSSAVLCLLFSGRKTGFHWALMGSLCFLVYESQPLWLAGLIPILLYYLFQQRKVMPLVFFLLPVIPLAVGAYVYKQQITGIFGSILIHNPLRNLTERLSEAPALLYGSLHGNHFFFEIQPPNFFCAFCAVSFMALIVLLLCRAVYNIISRKKDMGLFNVSCISLLLTLGYIIFGMQARYLLPVTGFALVALLLLVDKQKVRLRAVYTGVAAYIVCGAVSVVTFYDFEYSPVRENSLHKVISYLEANDVHYAYSNDNMFTWQLVFYSDEHIICRERQMPGRYGAYVREVDSAFYGGKKTAFIIPPGGYNDIDFLNIADVEGYGVVIDPPKEKIAKYFERLK